MICKICNKNVKDRYFKKHLKLEHSCSDEDYYINQLGNKKGICAEETCNNYCKFISILKGYKKCCCQTCANRYSTKERHKNQPIFGLEKTQKTNLKKYGNVCSLHGKEQIKKKHKTWKIKYGKNITHPMQSDKLQEKRINTCLKNYNCTTKEEYYKKVQEQIKDDLQKHGFDNNGNQKIINVFQLESTKLKAKNTKQKKYNDENYSNHDKAIKTCVEKYGSVFNNPKYSFDGNVFDSSWEVAYYIWLKDFKIDFIYHPDPIPYYWEGDGKIHNYYPDFKLNDRFVEIKNNYLLSKMNEQNSKEHAKMQILLENNVQIITNSEIKIYLDYISYKYGDNYIDNFRLGDKNE